MRKGDSKIIEVNIKEDYHQHLRERESDILGCKLFGYVTLAFELCKHLDQILYSDTYMFKMIKKIS